MPQSKAEAFLTYCHENGLSTIKQTSGMLNYAAKTGRVVKANKPDGSRFFYFDDRSVIEMRRDNSGKWALTVIKELEKDKDEND